MTAIDNQYFIQHLLSHLIPKELYRQKFCEPLGSYETSWKSYIWQCVLAKLFQLCPTLCDPRDYSLPGSSVHEDSPVKILEWVA